MEIVSYIKVGIGVARGIALCLCVLNWASNGRIPLYHVLSNNNQFILARGLALEIAITIAHHCVYGIFDRFFFGKLF